ncbi:MAG TPA: hypothetical protein VGD42_04390 [Lysobacter sp.]
MLLVIPAKAGIRRFARHSREGGNPGTFHAVLVQVKQQKQQQQQQQRKITGNSFRSQASGSLLSWQK